MKKTWITGMSIPLLSLLAISAIMLSVATSSTHALPTATAVTAPASGETDTIHNQHVELGPQTVLQKTVIPLQISPDNTLPWAFIEGTIKNPAEGHPVIIQIYTTETSSGITAAGSADGASVHFAQTEVNVDGSYEYRFRVTDVSPDDGTRTNIFEGDYLVHVFKVVEATAATPTQGSPV